MKALCLILLLALSMPACSRFSKSARQQRAYSNYVRKSSVMRTRQQSRFLKSSAPRLPRTEPGPVTETSTQGGPQSVSQGQGDQ